MSKSILWEGEGLTVFDDGSCKGFGLLDPVGVCRALARALAEAKRETATLKAAAEGDLKATDADRGNASLAWGCAGSLQTALRRERANRMEFARKAAEAMRERAEELAYAAAAKMTDATSRDVLLAIGHRIGDLSLE